uniref:SagB/ThcOx family dehydrogenase n=1 Tax=Type-D symbiont of Plautia stali TaxID=1560356 RepID=UPI001428AA4A
LTQHEFSLNKVDIQACRGKHHPERAPSANEFTAHFPLAREIFETIFINSLGASTSQRVLRYPYPSGGALYSGQAIVFINNVEGYKKGSYHYLPISNQFEKLDSLCESIVNDALFIRNDHNLKNYDFFILYGSLIDKHLCKYGYRGYRLAILEIGSMYRNTELELQRLNLGSTIWGGFQDEALSVALGIDPRVVIPVICQIVGR